MPGECGFCGFKVENPSEALAHILACPKTPRQTRRRILREMEKADQAHQRCEICQRPIGKGLRLRCEQHKDTPMRVPYSEFLAMSRR